MALNKLKIIKEALKDLTENVWRYHAPDRASLPYLVWAEDGASDFIANGCHCERAWQGTIDLYTSDEDDGLINGVSEALDQARVAWYLNSVQYEEGTGVIHYEWVFEV